MFDQISYAKTVYGNEEIEAVVKCLKESTQMGKYARKYEFKIAKLFDADTLGVTINGKPPKLRDFANNLWEQLEGKGNILFGEVPYRDNEIMRYVRNIEVEYTIK